MKFQDSMPKVKKSKPIGFIDALNKLLKWTRKNRPNGISYAEILIKTYASGGYIRLNNEDSITVDFTHWVYPPIKSAKELLKIHKKRKSEFSSAAEYFAKLEDREIELMLKSTLK